MFIFQYSAAKNAAILQCSCLRAEIAEASAAISEIN